MKSYVRVFPYKNKIVSIYYKDGVRHIDEVKNYKFEYFTESDGKDSDFLDYKTRSKKLKVIVNNSIKSYRDSINRYKELNLPIYSNASPEDQYRFKEFSNDKDNNLHLSYFDIETGFNGTIVLPNGELKRGKGGFPKLDGRTSVTSITIYSDKLDKFFVFGLKDYTPSKNNVEYIKCLSEYTMLIDFFKLVNKIQVDALIGWNSSGFDNPFLINRLFKIIKDNYIEKNGKIPKEDEKAIENKILNKVGSILSHYYKINKPNNFNKSKSDLLRVEPLGYYFIDLLDFYEKFRYSKTPDSYKLDSIAKLEGISGKLQYSEDYLYEIELENGEILTLKETDNIKLKDGRIIKVKELTEIDEISDV